MIPFATKEVCFLQNGYQLYEFIIRGILNAKDKVVISSLYIGASVKEDLMVSYSIIFRSMPLVERAPKCEKY